QLCLASRCAKMDVGEKERAMLCAVFRSWAEQSFIKSTAPRLCASRFLAGFLRSLVSIRRGQRCHGLRPRQYRCIEQSHVLVVLLQTPDCVILLQCVCFLLLRVHHARAATNLHDSLITIL